MTSGVPDDVEAVARPTPSPAAPEPKSVGQLQRAVRAYARDRGIAEKRVRDWISYMAVGGCLENAASKIGQGRLFSLKGGVVMELRRAGAARATQDLDLTYHGIAPDLVQAIEDGISQPYGRFSFRRSGQPHEMPHVNAVRVEIAVRFDGEAWSTVVVDLARSGADSVEVELVPAFDIENAFGVQGPENVTCLSARYHLAHKLHGMTKVFPDGRINERVQDAVDALLLRELVPDLTSIREACVAVFGSRAQQPWPPKFNPPEMWTEPFGPMAAAVELDVRDLPTATETLRQYILEIDAALPR